MDKKILIVFALIILSSSVYALSKADIVYPVSELGNCASETDCQAYCDNNANIEACLTFGEKYGLMSQAEIDEAKKVMKFILDGTTPGGCKSKQECDSYCEKEENLNECIDFAVKAGFIPPEEAAMAKKTGGKGPGGCKRDACKTYCEDESHINECIDFAVQNGMMSAEEAAMAKKTGGKGPGGCKSKEECDTFCNNPDNQETCMNFGIEHGLIPPEDLEKMKKNQEFMNSEEGKCTMQCLKEAGVDSKACGENGAGPEACKTCGEKCFPHDQTSGGKCLSQERWQELNQDCTSKGSGYHLEDVKGDNGQGEECVVDMKCVYSSGDQWESQAEKDKRLEEMQKQWDEDRAKYEAEHGPGSSTEGNPGGSGGGCTQPGPEGQCNPGPGAGPEPGSEGSGSGSDSGSSSGGSGSEGSGSSGSDTGSGGNSGSSSDTSSEGSEGGITGGVISNSENQNSIFVKIYNFFKEVFN